MKIAVSSSEEDEIVIYFGNNTPARIRLGKMKDTGNVSATWFNPVNGLILDAGIHPVVSTVLFTPPNGWEDAVLIYRSRTKK